jgi:hypothetical protein
MPIDLGKGEKVGLRFLETMSDEIDAAPSTGGTQFYEEQIVHPYTFKTTFNLSYILF